MSCTLPNAETRTAAEVWADIRTNPWAQLTLEEHIDRQRDRLESLAQLVFLDRHEDIGDGTPEKLHSVLSELLSEEVARSQLMAVLARRAVKLGLSPYQADPERCFPDHGEALTATHGSKKGDILPMSRTLSATPACTGKDLWPGGGLGDHLTPAPAVGSRAPEQGQGLAPAAD